MICRINQRYYMRATPIWILYIIHPSPLFSALFRSAVALSVQDRRHTWTAHKYTIQSLPVRSSLKATEGSENNTNNRVNNWNMIVRVRSNIGTVKLTIEDEEKATESTIRTAIFEDLQRRTSKTYKLTQDLSFDPAGTRRIHSSQTLSEQGIRHGCMVYCRVEEEPPQDPIVRSKDPVLGSNGVTCSENEVSIKNKGTAGSEKAAAANHKNDVIDLIDSSDDEEGGDNQYSDDDDVQVISPRSARAIRKKEVTIDEALRARKRQRSALDFRPASVANENSSGYKKNSNFQIASYNVWFGPPDPEAKQVFPKERMAGIVNSLQVACKSREREEDETCPLLFVGLQELTTNLVQYLDPNFQSIGYRLYTQPLGGFGPTYGVGIAVPDDLVVLERKFVPYQNSIQGRGFLFVRTQTVLFTTTHLESWCGPQFTGSKEREVQIVEAARFCQEQLKSFKSLELAVIAGDLNWDDERKRKQSESPNRNLLSVLPKGWKDAGAPFDYTYDAKENPMLNGNLRRRFDRCVYITNQHKDDQGSSQQNKSYKSMGLQKFGKKSISNIIWNKKNPYNDTIKKMPVSPSDHFGIMIPFSKKAPS